MNIGVFGDSFAMASYERNIWWRVLEQQFGHTVTSYGQSGSSIEYSAVLIEQLHTQFDFMIWCLTWPNRASLKTPDGYIHTGNLVGKQKKTGRSDIDAKINACIEYSNLAVDHDATNLIYRTAAYGFLQRYPNLMIIPCFDQPMHTPFNLFSLSLMEVEHYFPAESSFSKVLSKYHDMRPAHLTIENNMILAQLINHDLKSGIFQTEYSNFSLSDTPITDNIFKKIQ